MAIRTAHLLMVGILLGGSLNCAGTALAQAQPPTRAVEVVGALTTEERAAVEQTISSDARIRAIIGEGQPRITTTGVEIDKAQAEAFLAGTSDTPPSRQLGVVLFNPRTNQAARALVSPSQKRVVAVEAITASDVPFAADDASDALKLAKADPAVRAAVGETLSQYEIAESGTEARAPFAAHALPLRSTDPRDVCSMDRCIDLIFQHQNGYLPFRAHVDLTRRTVEVHGGGGQHR